MGHKPCGAPLKRSSLLRQPVPLQRRQDACTFCSTESCCWLLVQTSCDEAGNFFITLLWAPAVPKSMIDILC